MAVRHRQSFFSFEKKTAVSCRRAVTRARLSRILKGSSGAFASRLCIADRQFSIRDLREFHPRPGLVLRQSFPSSVPLRQLGCARPEASSLQRTQPTLDLVFRSHNRTTRARVEGVHRRRILVGRQSRKPSCRFPIRVTRRAGAVMPCDRRSDAPRRRPRSTPISRRHHDHSPIATRTSSRRAGCPNGSGNVEERRSHEYRPVTFSTFASITRQPRSSFERVRPLEWDLLCACRFQTQRVRRATGRCISTLVSCGAVWMSGQGASDVCCAAIFELAKASRRAAAGDLGARVPADDIRSGTSWARLRAMRRPSKR